VTKLIVAEVDELIDMTIDVHHCISRLARRCASIHTVMQTSCVTNV